MAIEKLPAAPVNLSGGSLLSRQPSNIPEAGNLLGNVAESLVKAYEPTLKAAAIKEAEVNAAVVGVVRGPNGEFVRPPEPDGGLIYNEVYNKAIDQAYASSISYDFQMKADKIIADNYTDPQKAITLMNATLAGATKGMDPRFTSIVTPILQNELQQRAAGVLNRKAGDDREALNRTNSEMLDAHLNSFMDAWKTGNIPKADQLRGLIVDTARNAIALNLYSEDYITAINAKMEIARSRGIKAGEVEARTKRIETLQLAKAERELADLDRSEQAMNVILSATTLMNPDQISALNDIRNGDTRASLTIDMPTPDGGVEKVTLDAATYRYLFSNPKIEQTVGSAIGAMHRKNEELRAADQKRVEQRAIADKILGSRDSGLIPNYDAKEKDVADAMAAAVFEKNAPEGFDLKTVPHQMMAVATATALGRTDSQTTQFIVTGIRSNDPQMVAAAADLYENLRIAKVGQNEIGSALIKDLSSEDIKFLEYAKKLNLNKAFSPEDRMLHLSNARNGITIPYDRMRTMFDQSYDQLLYQQTAEALGLPSDRMEYTIPEDILRNADEYTRMYAASGDATAALKSGVSAATMRYVKDERALSGIGVRNFDSIVPKDIMKTVLAKYPKFPGTTLGKDVKYQVLYESNADTPIIRFVAVNGKIATAIAEIDPRVDIKPEARAEIAKTGPMFAAARSRVELDRALDEELRAMPGGLLARKIIDSLPLSYDLSTGAVKVTDK